MLVIARQAVRTAAVHEPRVVPPPPRIVHPPVRVVQPALWRADDDRVAEVVTPPWRTAGLDEEQGPKRQKTAFSCKHIDLAFVIMRCNINVSASVRGNIIVSASISPDLHCIFVLQR